MKVLDKGELTLLDFMGGDLAVVQAARVSNAIDYENASKGPEADEKLIRYLVKHRHGSPFEHSYFKFFVKAPLFVVREWQRHRMASYNEVSGRYVKFHPEFYTPEQWRIPGSTTKQGSVVPDGIVVYEQSPGVMIYEGVEQWNKAITDVYEHAMLFAYHTYEDLIDQGVANEQARMVLPLSTYTSYYFTVNARSLMNFLGLRSGSDAQWEIQEFARAGIEIFKKAMPMTYQAWEDNGRIAP